MLGKLRRHPRRDLLRPAMAPIHNKIVSVVLVAVIVMASARQAHAFGISDLWSGFYRVIGLRSLVKQVTGGAAEGFREELEKLFDDKINPLVDRADAILHNRLEELHGIVQDSISQITDSLVVALQDAEGVLKRVIDNAGIKAQELIKEFFADLNRTLAKTLNRVDAMLDNLLCRVAPDGRGISIANTIFSRRPDRIRVWRPGETACYRHYVDPSKHPESKVFDSWQYYEGEMCDEELRVAQFDPTSTPLINYAAHYEELAGLAKKAICLAPSEERRTNLLNHEVMFERRARMFRELADGRSRLIESWLPLRQTHSGAR